VKTQFGWHVIAVLQKAYEPLHMQVQELAEVLVSTRTFSRCLRHGNAIAVAASRHDSTDIRALASSL
jgi:hypothetical protein